MSKKDYEMIAAIIRDRMEADSWAATALKLVAHDLADKFAEGNARFNRHTFLTACGV